MDKKMKENERKGKKTRTGRKHENKKIHEYYEIKGNEVIRKKKSCPRCGGGTYLAQHKGRLYCGKCAYTEFEKNLEEQSPKKEVEKAKEEPKEESAAETAPEEPKEEKAEETKE